GAIRTGSRARGQVGLHDAIGPGGTLRRQRVQNWHAHESHLLRLRLVSSHRAALRWTHRAQCAVPSATSPTLRRSRYETRSHVKMSDQQQPGSKPTRAADGNEQADAKRQAALKGALAQIEKQYGKGAVM